MFQNDTIGNPKFSVSRRDMYYHSYRNLPNDDEDDVDDHHYDGEDDDDVDG